MGVTINFRIAMKNLITITFLFFTVLGFSQDSEIYKLAFKDKNNFDYLNLYDKSNLNKLRVYKIYDKTHCWNTNYFKIRDVDINDKRVLDSIVRYEHHPYNHTYLFKKESLKKLFNNIEQEYLFQKSINNGGKRFLKFNDDISIIRTFPEIGIYFTISSIIYSSDNQYAFLYVGVFQDLEYFGRTFFIFKRESKDWVQIYIEKDIIL